jgi:hypothetical protein
MARPLPTDTELTAKRPDIESFLTDPNTTLQTFAGEALGYLKRDLENKRGVTWSRVFVGSAYLDNSEGTGRNESNLVHCLILRTLALILEAYGIKNTDGQWMDLANYYRSEYDELLSVARLDIDIDDSGTISEDEERRSGQTFLRK